MCLNKRFFSEPTLTVISVNIEGMSPSKQQLLHELCREQKCDVLCIQETHRDTQQRRPKVPGLQLAAEIPHAKHGSAIFVKPGIHILSVHCTHQYNIEIITLELSNCVITSVYKPPSEKFSFAPPKNFDSQRMSIVIGDFNSHSHAWGYTHEDENGEAVISWAESNHLSLIHDSKLPPSFNSGRWQRGYNPDLLFVSDNIAQQCQKSVCSPIPNTQHRPIMCRILPIIRPQETGFRRRYNFKKADWPKFSRMLDEKVQTIAPVPEEYEHFVELVKLCSRACIPRGCRTTYIQGVTSETAVLLEEYYAQYDVNPFSEETSQTARSVLSSISEAKRVQWEELMENCDMGRSSQEAWRLLKRLSNDPSQANTHAHVRADQIAHQLSQNGKTPHTTRSGGKTLERKPDQETNILLQPFTQAELDLALSKCKNGKAAGLDDIRVEQIKNFGPITKCWLRELMNKCVQSCKIPKLWRKAKVIAIRKPGKDQNDPKSYRPISLLCHLYKVLERLILHRLMEKLETIFIPQQAGFRSGKSCTSQVMKLTQHIEDGFERKEITGAVFIDLTTAYDTVNHRRLLMKLYDATKDYQLTCFLRNLLENRRFFVEFQGRRSRWRSQKNGLPQGSVLAPALFNIYTNDQPLPEGTESFIYADDCAITAQADCFDNVEQKLSKALIELSAYYRENQLRPNPSKTQTCAFHLKNRQAARTLKITWEGTTLEHCSFPKYLGITLDRALTYRRHCLNTKQKVAARNNIIRKLTGTTWGAHPSTVRTSSLALCYSAGEYASPVWHKSSHAKVVDIALNDTCRIITGCLKPTSLDKLYTLAGIAPPDIRREVAASSEKKKAETSEAHPLYGYRPAKPRLKSRKSFLRSTEALVGTSQQSRTNLWRVRFNSPGEWLIPSEKLPAGYTEKWSTWKSLNRLRSGVTRCKSNLFKWGLHVESPLCECGTTQTSSHLLQCSQCPTTCTLEDLLHATPNAIEVANFWAAKV